VTEVAAKLDARLQQWDAAKAAEVERLVNEIIALADADSLELMHQREQAILNLLGSNLI
jgi:hypothetical protein